MPNAAVPDPAMVVRRWDRIFDAVASEPRRQLIVSLMDADGGPVFLPEAAANPNLPHDRDELRLRLRHRDLPVLAESGYVEYEHDPLRAFRGPRFEDVAIVFEALHACAEDVPDHLVLGCRRLERERRRDGPGDRPG